MNAEFDLLLAGAGHAHLGVLRQWFTGQRPQGRIALIGTDITFTCATKAAV